MYYMIICIYVRIIMYNIYIYHILCIITGAIGILLANEYEGFAQMLWAILLLTTLQPIWDFTKAVKGKNMTLEDHIGHSVSHCSPSCGLKTLPWSQITNHHELERMKANQQSVIITNHGSPQIIAEHSGSSLIVAQYPSLSWPSPRHIMVGVGVKSNPGGPGEHSNTRSMNVQWMFIPRMFEIPGQMIPTSRPLPLWDFLPFLSCFGKRTEKGWKRLVSRHQRWLSIFVLTADRSCREYPQAHSNTRYQKKDVLCVFFLGPCM